MCRKKFITFFLSIVLLLFILPSSSVGVMPRWYTVSNIFGGYNPDIRTIFVDIQARPEVTKIENIEIELHKISGAIDILIKQWPTMSVDDCEFYFDDEINNVQTGYTYHLSVTADVHGLGIIEEISKTFEIVN